VVHCGYIDGHVVHCKGDAPNLNLGVTALKNRGGGINAVKTLKFEKDVGCMTPSPAPMVVPLLVHWREM